MDQTIKIFTASLAGTQKHKAYAVFDGEKLVITHIVPIVGAFGSWKNELIDEVKKRRAAGYACVIEEKTNIIARHASQFNLEDMDESGRSNIYLALDWYFPMMDMGNIVIAKEFQKFIIRAGGEGQRVEKDQDEKGRVVYRINWGQFNGGHRAMLLCVIAAMVEPISDRYVEEILAALLPNHEPDDPLQSFKAVTPGL